MKTGPHITVLLIFSLSFFFFSCNAYSSDQPVHGRNIFSDGSERAIWPILVTPECNINHGRLSRQRVMNLDDLRDSGRMKMVNGLIREPLPGAIPATTVRRTGFYLIQQTGLLWQRM